MFKDIKKHVKSYSKCQFNKSIKTCKQPMQVTSTASELFEKISLDIVSTLQLTESQNRNILTF